MVDDVAAVVVVTPGRLCAACRIRRPGHERRLPGFRGHVPADLKEDKQKVIARQMGYFAADMLDASRRFDKIPEAFEQIIKTYGQDDDTLARFGAWIARFNRKEVTHV